MRAVIQRVSRASVTWSGGTSAIARGLLILLGVGKGDTAGDAEWLAAKCTSLRIFEDDAGKMNRSVVDLGGDVLVVSQFTLHGDCRKGRRPSFDRAMPPAGAIPLYEAFVGHVRAAGLTVGTGEFGAMMAVELVNDGPVTLIVDSPERHATAPPAASRTEEGRSS